MQVYNDLFISFEIYLFNYNMRMLLDTELLYFLWLQLCDSPLSVFKAYGLAKQAEEYLVHVIYSITDSDVQVFFYTRSYELIIICNPQKKNLFVAFFYYRYDSELNLFCKIFFNNILNLWLFCNECVFYIYYIFYFTLQ